MKYYILYLMPLLSMVCCLENGLARTPPMGWLTWERFRCNTDCKNDPDNCISEKLIKTMADHMVSDGYKDAGYEYVNIDDCWLAKERDPKTQRLVPDPDRFPNGMKAVAEYVHSKGLKFGIYEDFGTRTCAGYPGSEYHLQLDAQTFADWGVDYLKLDTCNSEVHMFDRGYPPMAMWLAKTKRPIVLSCEYPGYQRGAGIKVNYTLVSETCNLARNYLDVSDSWESVYGIIEYYGSNMWEFAEAAKPGYWNDPDELIIGNFGLSYGQERAQMALWSLMASPLIMSTDLRNIRPESKAILQNKGAIAINQDALGKQGKRISMIGKVHIWTKPILPSGSMAFVFLNTGDDGTPFKVSCQIKDLDLNSAGGYNVTEVFDGQHLGTYKPDDTFTAIVNPLSVLFARADILSKK